MATAGIFFPVSVAFQIGQDDWYTLYVDGHRKSYGHSMYSSEAGELLVNRYHVTKFYHLFLDGDPDKDPKFMIEHFGEHVQDIYGHNNFIEYSFPEKIPDDVWEQLIALK